MHLKSFSLSLIIGPKFCPKMPRIDRRLIPEAYIVVRFAVRLAVVQIISFLNTKFLNFINCQENLREHGTSMHSVVGKDRSCGRSNVLNFSPQWSYVKIF